MLIGAHSIIYSIAPEADRAFLGDVLRLPNVDVGEGWLIFGLPPAEVAVHPSNENDGHELYLMCDDIDGSSGDENAQDRRTPVQDQGWGRLSQITLPVAASSASISRSCAPGAGKRHALRLAPMDLSRRSQSTIERMFAPELELIETDVTDFAAPLPFGSTVRGIGYGFVAAVDDRWAR